MALFQFGKKNKEKKEAVHEAAPKKRDARVKKEADSPEKGTKTGAPSVQAHVARVLVRPRITEKATFAAEDGVYVFDVSPGATKTEVREAIKHYYKVAPRKVNMVTIPRKLVRSRTRGRFGVTAKGKKAYVYLKEGDTIEVV